MELAPIPMILFCPVCHGRHVDRGEWATTRRHKTHECEHCGVQWRPSNVATVGVQSLSGEGLSVAAPPGTVWFPIVMAPKDRPVLVCRPEWIVARIMSWQGGKDGGFGAFSVEAVGGSGIEFEQPLYWALLPPLPKP